MSNKPRKPDKPGKAAFQLETLEKRILFSADLPFPVAELSSLDTTGYIGLVSAAESFAQSSTTSANSEQHAQAPVEIVIIDSATPDYESIVADLEKQANSAMHVVILEADRDGIEQISGILSQFENVGALHLISHGADGELMLGNSTVDFTELLVRADEFAAWQNSFTADADLLIYGCDLASTDIGRSFVSTLGNLTGTDVAASDDLTGSALLGGDWDLEFRTGAVESSIALSDAAQTSWNGVLSATVDSSSSGSTSGSILTVSHTTSGTDRLMIVGISMDAQTSASVSSVTYNGSALTLVGTIQEAGSNVRVELWQMVAPATGSNDVVVTFTQAMTEGGIAGIVTFNGVDQTTPLGSFASAEGSGTNASVNVSADVGDLVFSTMGLDGSSDTALNEGAGQTEYWEVFQPGTEGAGSTKVATSTSETMAWTLASNQWAIGGVAIKAYIPASVNFTIDSTASISEDLAEQSSFNVTLGGDALVGGNTASVDIIGSGSALSGTDYDNFVTAIVNAAGATTGVTFDGVDTLTFDSTFNGGTGQGTFSFTVDAIDDIAQEGTETIIATLSNASVISGTVTFGSVHDSFTEASNTPITAHLSNTGLGWTEVYDSSTAGTDATIDATLDVLNGGSDENSVGQAYTAGPAPTNVDQTISFTLSAIDTTTGTKPVGVFGRYIDNDNFYYLQVLTNGNAQDSLQLAKMEGGVVTTLGSIDVTITAGDTFKLEITDATKKIYHNGIEVVSSTDNSLTAIGNWGLYFGDFNGIGGHLRPTWGIDDFLAQDSASTAIATTLITETDINNAPHAADDRQGVDFDGIEDHVLIGTDAALEMSATMTIEAWINPDGSANLNTMIVNREGEYEVALASDNTIQWAFANTDPAWGWHNTGVAAELGEWSHIAVTYDNGDVTTYLNGVQIDFYDGSGTIGDSHATLDEFRIGGRQNNPTNQSFDGRIADVRIWDAARSGVDIAADMNTTLTGGESNLVGYWKLDENSYTATDSAGSNDGALAVNADPSGYWVAEGTTINEAAPGVLANDFDADGDPLTISEVNGNAANVGSQFALASGALLTLNADGSFDYDTNGAFESLEAAAITTDSFTYTATDGSATDTATVTIQIVGVNDAPTITSTAGTTATEDTLYTYTATVTDPDDANNGTDLTWSLSGEPAGMVVSNTGVVTWTPAEGVTTSGAVTLTVSDGNEDGAVDATEVFTITVTPVNDGPTITSTAGTTATEDTLYTYTATVVDPDDANNGTDLTWSLSGEPTGMVVSSTGVVTWTPTEGVTSSGAVTLTVSDGNEDGAVDATEVFTITVTPVNDGPTITSTAGTTATEDTLYTYTATVVDPDDANNGTDLTWSLSGAPAGMVVSSTGVVTWTPTEGVTTSGAVTLTVSDGNEDGAVDATEVFTISVTPVNDGPTITSTAGTTATEDTLYTYTATVTDPDDANNGTDLTWSLSGEPAGMVVSSTGVVTWTPTEGVTTSGAVTLTVSDGNEDGAVDATEVFTITVTPVNDGPTITSTAGTTATEDTLYTYTATVVDPDDANNGTDLTWSLSGEPTGMVVSSTGVVTWTPTEGVTSSGAVTLTVSDGNEDGAVDATEVFTITVTPVNDGPSITSTAGTTATEDTLYTYTATVVDPDDANNGTDLTWSLSGAPAGMVVSSTGVVTWTPTEGVTTSGAVTLTVSDGNEDGAVDATEVFTITVTPVNDGPVITSTAGTTATEDTLYTYTATVTDPDDANTGTDLTWSLSGEPAGMVVSSTGVVTWTPTEGVTTSGAVTLTVSDGNEDGAVDATEVFTISVTPVNDGPTITSTAGTAATEDTLYTYTATVVDPDDANNGTDLTWSLSGAPAGMVVSSTGVVTWTPTEGVTTSGAVTLTVSDGNEDGAVDATEVFTISVTPVNDGPTITSTAGTTATEDTLYTYTATVTDPDDANNGTDLTWSLSGEPAGMVVSSTGVVTWTPTEGVTTSGAVTLTVSDGNEDGAVDATEVFTITVTPVNDGPTITSTAGTTATEDTLYTYTATVVDPDDANNGTDLTWSLSGEPAGMVVSSTGVVTWTPTEGVTSSGAVTLTVSDGNEDGAVDATEVFTITVTPVNDGPTITSTAGTTATEDTLYTYTATVVDPDDANNGTDLTWSLSGAPAGMVVSSTGVVTWTPTEGVTTSGAVTLTVSDGNEDGAVDATEVFTISVTPVNDGPTITSTAGTTATEDTLYTYTATVVDPDDANNGTDLTWSLSGEPTGMVVSSTGVVTWTPTEGVTSSGAVTLTVSDGNEDGAVDATEVFTITVTPVNDGPSITSTAGTTATEDTLYTYTATVVDPDDANNGTDLTWSLSGAPAGMVVSSTGVVTWTPTEGVTTSGAVTLTVSDGNEDGAVDATEVFTITVTPVNDGPVITSTAGTTATEDTLYTYTATVTDPDDANNGTDLTWSLSGAPAGMVVSSTGVVTWTPTEGVTTSGAVTLTVSDGNEDGAVDATEVFTITVTPVNDGPVITSTAGTTATEDTLYTYTATVVDPDDANNGTDLTWSLSGAPAGMVVSSTGVVTWTPTEGVTTSGAVTLTVSDGNEDGAVDATEVFTITVTPVNDGPSITSTASTTATEDTLYTYTATVSDPDDANNGTDLTWSLSGAPAGMVVSSTGVVTWTPTEGVTTSGAVTLTVSDGNEDGAVDATEVFTITVTPLNDGPTITSTAGTTATEDTLYTYTATVVDPDDANNGTDLTWSLSGAPAGMVVSSTGVVTWTPTEGVTTSGAVTLTVSDGNEDGAVDATEVFTISVTPVNDGPTISSTAGTTATEDTLYTYTATVTDPDDANNGTDLTWSLSGEPAGMVVSSTGVVTWTPTEGVTSSGAVTLTVSDGNEDGAVDATEVFTITVTPVNDGPTITSTAGTTATEDTLYTYTATVVDPDDANNGTDLTWSLSGAPAGMVVSSTGVVTWTPTEGVTTSGAVTLTVSDGNEDGAVDATEVFTISVTPVNDGPTITSTAGTAATEDTLYTYTATVTDPDDANNGTDLTWSLSGEPAGMVVSSTGVVTWTPTEGVTTSGAVTLTVSDGNEDGAVDATEVFTITVTPVNDGPVITSTAGTTATEDTLYTYTATVVDPDDANNGTDLTWSLSGAPAGMVVSSTGVVTWTPTEGVTTSGAVTLTVSDGNEDGAVDATEVFTITVTPVNDGPSITSTASTTATEDTLYTYTATVSDPDDANNGTDLTWSLSGAPAGMVVSSTGVVTWTPTEGVTTSGAVTLTVSDGNEDGAVDATEVFTITVTPVNDGPTITSTAGTTATEDTLYTYTATVTDPDDANNGTDLTWSLSGAPAGMVVSSTGVVTWTPTEGVTTSGAVTLTVSDGNEDGAVDATEVFTISVTPVNDGPTISSTAGTTATEDTLYTYTATVTDPDDANNGTDLTWSLSGEPAGMVVSSTGVVTWTPTEGVKTSGAVTLTVSDGNEDGAVDATEVFTVAVTPVNDGPMATGNTIIATEDVPLIIGPSDFGFTDVEGDSLTSVTITGLTLNGGTLTHSTGTVTVTNGMTITAAELADLTFTSALNNSTDSSFTYTVNDSGTGVTSAAMNITVIAVNDAPTFTSPTTYTVAENVHSVATLISSDIDGAAPTYSLVGSADDDRFIINATTGELRFLNAPDFENPIDAGADNIYNVSVQVSDGRGAVVTQAMTVTVNDVNEAPSLATVEFTATEGFIGNIGQLITTDPDAGDQVTLSIVGGNAQAFFSVDPSSGAISQESSLAPGTYTLEVQLNDANGMTINALLQIRIDAAEPDLGTANNAGDNVQPDREPADTTNTFSNYAPLTLGIDAPTHPGIPTIAENGNTAGSDFANLLEEPASEASSSTSATGNAINTLFPANLPATHHFSDPSNATEAERTDSHSRGYSLVLELLFGEAEEAFDEFGNAFASIMDGSLFSITLTPDMLNALSSMHSDVDEQQQQADERLGLILKVGTVASVTFTVGFVTWLLQTGSLLATALSTSPLWRAIDPVPVLKASQNDDDRHPGQQRTGTRP